MFRNISFNQRFFIFKLIPDADSQLSSKSKISGHNIINIKPLSQLSDNQTKC